MLNFWQSYNDSSADTYVISEEPSWDLLHLYSKTAIKVGTVLLVLVVLYLGAKAPTCIPVLIYKCKGPRRAAVPRDFLIYLSC